MHTCIMFIRSAYCLTKATNTRSEYIIHSVFPLQQWLHERASMLRYMYVAYLYVQVTVHRDKLRIKQPTRLIKYPKFILSKKSTCFGHLLYPSSGVICCTHGHWFQPDSSRKRSHNRHETYQLSCVQQITPDDGHSRCPKHVEFYDKINFGYLMHLVGCFVRNLSRFTVT
jgi:hypothetical protein